MTERLLGLGLPDDFKELLRVIPVGKYAGTVLVSPPTSTSHRGDLTYPFRELFKTLRSLRGKEKLYPVFPDLPGLLPWAKCYRQLAGHVFWLADKGDPNEWPVVLTNTALERWEQYDVGAVEFLTVLVKDELPSDIIPSVAGLPRYRTYQDLEGVPSNQGAAGE
ncbi:MAG: hypothetical protein ACJ72N_01720 [Labedaea sp.]